MSTEQRPEEGYVLSWSDLGLILVRSKKKIVRGAFLCALLAGLFTLSRDVTYTAQGTFREKSKQQNSNEKTLSALLMSGGATASESMAMTTIKSRRVLEKVVHELSLQGTVQPKDDRSYIAQKLSHYAGNIFDNLIVEEAYLSKKYKPIVEEPPQDLLVRDIHYTGEIALTMELRFIDHKQFKIYDEKDVFIGSGELGQPVTLPHASFSIQKQTPGDLLEASYVLSITPSHRIAHNLLGNLVIEADKLDKTLLKISYTDTNRFHSSLFLNNVMHNYRNFLVDEHVRVSLDQIAYLKQRQEDMDKQLVILMEDHAVNIASNDASIEFLVKTQQSYKSKLLNIDLEARHLEKAQKEGISFFERHSADGDSTVVQNLIGEIRKYRQQADALELALRNAHVYSTEVQEITFNHYVDELQEAHYANKDIKQLLASLEEGKVSYPSSALMSNPKYLLKPWYNKLDQADKERANARSEAEKIEKEDDYARSQAHFGVYLANLQHLFEVQEKTTRDRLTHQQNPQMEFQGIDLETANGLYIAYSRELHSLEADLAQKEFVIQQLSQPEFEVSSINSIIEDTISREIIAKTSSLMLTLKDEPNRTAKELERLRRDIEIQKSFLIVHLKQMCDILRLREQLLEDKIHSLQNVTLELIRQKISIQEKHLTDYIASRLNNLKHEKQIITQHQDELQKELDLLPEKWASQKLIDQHMNSNLSIVHQIASMIESKTIGENLEVSQSAPFDEAVVPVLPRDPRLGLFALIGGVGGAFLTLSFCLVQSAVRGVEATTENLQNRQQHVAGTLGSFPPFANIDSLNRPQLETLRKLLMQLCPGDAGLSPRRVVLIENHASSYKEAFAVLMAKRGLKILLMPLSFEQEEESEEKPGLLDVLEGRASFPHITSGPYFDTISSGGHSLFGKELLETKAFEDLLSLLSKEYHCIVGYTKAAATSAEAESLLHLFPSAAVTLHGEKMEQLTTYFKASLQGKTISFVFADK